MARRTTRTRAPQEARLVCMGSSVTLISPYDHHLIEGMKQAIPTSDRLWDKDSKAWTVDGAHLDTLKKLCAAAFGQEPAVQGSLQPTASEASVGLLKLEYLGTCKLRDSGESSAFGWYQGGWNLLMPESALLQYFGECPRTPEQATHFQVLGVKPGTDWTALKSAYRRMIKQWHPDVCREPDAADQFRRIQRAYEVLNDPGRRQRYEMGLLLMAKEAAREKKLQPLQGYRSPLRSGYVLARVVHKLGARVQVVEILDWKDIVNEQGQTWVASWPAGAEHFEGRWV